MIENTNLHTTRPSVRTILLFVCMFRSNISTLRIKKILSLSIRLKVLTNKPSQHTMSDQYWSASKTPFKWHFVGRPILARFLAHLSRRLMGELIVNQSLRRPSVVRPSTISNIFSSETTGPINFKLHMETP